MTKLPEKIPLGKAAEDLSAIADLLEESGDLDEALVKVFGEAHALQKDAVDRNFLFHQYVKSQIALAKDMADNWKHQKDVMQNVLERHKDRIKFIMEANPDIPFKGAQGKMTLQASPSALNLAFQSSKRTFETISDHDITKYKVDASYVDIVQLKALNKEKVKEDLKAGRELPFARLTQSKHVRFKV